MINQRRLKRDWERTFLPSSLVEPFGVSCESNEPGFHAEDDVDLKLNGKVALVTGSTAGIGLSIAKSLASEGAHVYVNGRTQQRVDAAIAAIRSHAAGVKVDGIAADFSDSAGAEAVIAKLSAVDVLVNNVGIFEPKLFAEIPDRLVPFLRDQRNERSLARATLSYRNAEEELGPHPFYVERVGGTDPGRDGALRNDENGTDCRGSRDCGVGGGNRCDREQYCCRSNGVGRCGQLCRGNGEAAEQVEVRGREGVL